MMTGIKVNCRVRLLISTDDKGFGFSSRSTTVFSTLVYIRLEVIAAITVSTTIVTSSLSATRPGLFVLNR